MGIFSSFISGVASAVSSFVSSVTSGGSSAPSSSSKSTSTTSSSGTTARSSSSRNTSVTSGGSSAPSSSSKSTSTTSSSGTTARSTSARNTSVTTGGTTPSSSPSGSTGTTPAKTTIAGVAAPGAVLTGAQPAGGGVTVITQPAAQTASSNWVQTYQSTKSDGSSSTETWQNTKTGEQIAFAGISAGDLAEYYANKGDTSSADKINEIAAVKTAATYIHSSAPSAVQVADQIAISKNAAAYTRGEAIQMGLQLGMQKGSNNIISPGIATAVINNALNPFYAWKDEQYAKANENLANGDILGTIVNAALPFCVDTLLPTDAVNWVSQVYQGNFDKLTSYDHTVAAIDTALTIFPLLRIAKPAVKAVVSAAGTAGGIAAYQFVDEPETSSPDETAQYLMANYSTKSTNGQSNALTALLSAMPATADSDEPTYTPTIANTPETPYTPETPAVEDGGQGILNLGDVLGTAPSAWGASANTTPSQNIISYAGPAVIAGIVVVILAGGYILVSKKGAKHGTQT